MKSGAHQLIVYVLVLMLSVTSALSQMSAHNPSVNPMENAPTPYTAEQIREACPPGRMWILRMDTPGGKVHYKRTTFTQVDDTSAVFEDQEVDEAFNPIGEPTTGHATWEGLRLHAQFPAALTTIVPTSLTNQLGTHPVKIYRVRSQDADEADMLFYFADDLPGPPIKLTVDTDSGELIIFEMVHRSLEKR